MIGRIVFAWLQGSNLDSNAKVPYNLLSTSFCAAFSMLLRLLRSNSYSSTFISDIPLLHCSDSYLQSFRLLADVLNDLAMFLELLSPIVPALFLPLLCCGSILRAIVGVAGGATRAALTQHQARNHNMASEN